MGKFVYVSDVIKVNTDFVRSVEVFVGKANPVVDGEKPTVIVELDDGRKYRKHFNTLADAYVYFENYK